MHASSCTWLLVRDPWRILTLDSRVHAQGSCLKFSVFTTLTKGFPLILCKVSGQQAAVWASLRLPARTDSGGTYEGPAYLGSLWRRWPDAHEPTAAQAAPQGTRSGLRLHADLKHHRPGVGTVSYARQTLCYLDFLACHSKLHKSLPESCFVPLTFVTKCAEQRDFPYSPTRSADTTLSRVPNLG